MAARRLHLVVLLAASHGPLACRSSPRSEAKRADASPPAPAALSATNLTDARRGFHTRVHDPSPRSEPPPTPPAGIFTLVHYASPVGLLPAYVTPRPTDGKRHPAIVWLHGGFDPSIDEFFWATKPRNNDQTARAFREAGMVLMLPACRGGNDNPAPREMFFGEVDDVIAAADYLEKVDYVDPARVYLGGHSTGGTLALLVAESTDRFRATFAFGPVGNMKNYFASADETTFDLSDETEVRLRSPAFFLGGIHRPTFVLEGAVQPSNASVLRKLVPRDPSVPVRTFLVPGVSHFSILAPVTELLARKLVTSDGDISLSEAELAAATTKP
jgi:acetyl esterase/lipase